MSMPRPPVASAVLACTPGLEYRSSLKMLRHGAPYAGQLSGGDRDIGPVSRTESPYGNS
ncbi:hypothetical protein BRAS3809_7720028 [Bradyrhizobium sp. STM 3809]|nr:hypothetical protein BRAS3809_7720028 [Bradyrhizobium sp. STM 3809]